MIPIMNIKENKDAAKKVKKSIKNVPYQKMLEMELEKSLQDLSKRQYFYSNNEMELEQNTLQLLKVLKKMENILENFTVTKKLSEQINDSLEIIHKDFFKRPTEILKKSESKKGLKNNKNDKISTISLKSMESSKTVDIRDDYIPVDPHVSSIQSVSLVREKQEMIAKIPEIESSTHSCINNKNSSVTEKKNIESTKLLDQEEALFQPKTEEKPPTYVNIPNLRDTVAKAIALDKIFLIDGYFQQVRDSLTARGWVEKVHSSFFDTLNEKNRALMHASLKELMAATKDVQVAKVAEMLLKSRMVQTSGKSIDFYWVYSTPAAIKKLEGVTKQPYVNKLLCDLSTFTTKIGLSQCQENMHWYQKENGRIFYRLMYSRSYCFDDPNDVTSFKYDFRITAAVSLLKWIIHSASTCEFRLVSKFGQIPVEAFEFACNELYKYIIQRNHDDINCEVRQQANDYQWSEFLKYYIQATRYNHHFKEEYPITEHSIVQKSLKIYNVLEQFFLPLDTDGYMNIWIAKPYDGTCGHGIKLSHNINELLDLPQKYIIQKYIEKPFLIHDRKFDIRQWFLISDLSPLTIWMYKECYLRFCSKKFSLLKLDDSIHLTNNAIQVNYIGRVNEPNIPYELMWTLEDFQLHMKKIGYGDTFKSTIYPEMKKSIIAAVLMNEFRTETTKRVFQLFGADFLIDENFQPWLIEINADPGMKGSTRVSRLMCTRVLEDVIKVIIDRRNDKMCSTGLFELIYKEPIPHTESVKVNSLLLRGVPTKVYPDSVTPVPERYSNLIKIEDFKPTFAEIKHEMKVIEKNLVTFAKKEKIRTDKLKTYMEFDFK